MKWEQVDFSNKRRSEPTLSLWKNMLIGISTGFFKKFNIKDNKGVEIFVSKDKKQIGIRFSKLCNHVKQTEVKTCYRSNYVSYYFQARQLKNLFNIDSEKVKLGKFNYNSEDNLFEIDLINK